MSEEKPYKKAPVPTAKWENADAYAIQALERGEATAEQQKRALAWIVNNACLTYEFENDPANERLSAIFSGRRFAGLQIVRLIKINLAVFKASK